jgi:hypothetical protein
VVITKGGTPSPSPSGGALSSAQQQALSDFASGIGASGGNSAGRVFMGMTGPKGNPRYMSEAGASRVVPNWMTMDDATNQYFTWSQKQRDDFRAKGLLSGLLTQGAGDLEAYSLWSNLTKQAALYGAQDQQVGPLDILSGYVKGNSSGGWVKNGNFEINPATGEKRYVGPKSRTTTQKQVDLTDPATAGAIATKLFQDLLGRDPGRGEIEAYASALSQSEAQNPAMSTTTTQFDPATGEATDSSTVTAGGVTADGKAQLAADEIKRTKEYGATQAATTYMNALTSAVGGG